MHGLILNSIENFNGKIENCVLQVDLGILICIIDVARLNSILVEAMNGLFS